MVFNSILYTNKEFLGGQNNFCQVTFYHQAPLKLCIMALYRCVYYYYYYYHHHHHHKNCFSITQQNLPTLRPSASN